MIDVSILTNIAQGLTLFVAIEVVCLWNLSQIWRLLHWPQFCYHQRSCFLF